MRRSDRLFDILARLRDGQLHRAQDLADALGVSLRTIYRDMDTLIASGIPVEGARGVGYILREAITLPPLTLTAEELEALNLGIAIVSGAADPGLKAAAAALGDKIDAVLAMQGPAEADAWKFAAHPFADAARGFSHMAVLRAAIRGRQKLRVTYHDSDGSLADTVLRPLLMEYWTRVWTLTAWCERRGDFRIFRVDLIDTATPLPELFVDEPGRTLADHRASQTERPALRS